MIDQGGGGRRALHVGGNAIKEFGCNDQLRYFSNGSTLVFMGRREPLYGEGYAGAPPVAITGPSSTSARARIAASR